MTFPHGASSARPPAGSTPDLPDPETGADPYLALEEIDGAAARAFVTDASARTEAALTGSPRYRDLRGEILEVLDAEDRIPLVTRRGDHLYNFWTDAEHERGLWRRTTLDSFATDSPQWDVLLDLDALNAAEDASWVWKGADVLYPARTRALVFLSPGGSDATVVREFDLTTREFVDDGFRLPASKGSATWADTSGSAIVFSRDTGPGSLTRSGYPRTVRRWQRGTSPDEATVLFEGEEEDVLVAASVDLTAGHERTVLHRMTTFYTSRTHLLEEDGPRELALPESAEPDLHRDWLTVLLREPWELPHITHEAGTLLGIRLTAFLQGSRDFAVLFDPTPTTSLIGASWTRSHLVLTVLDDVHHRVDVLTPPAVTDAPAATATPAAPGAEVPATPTARAWRRRPVAGRALLGAAEDDPTGRADPFLSLTAAPSDPRESDEVWLLAEGFLTPARLVLLDLDATGQVTTATPLKSAPHRFDTAGLQVRQHFVWSDDGTRVPYFSIGRTTGDAGEAGATPRPTLLAGYGGFEVPELPAYLGATGRAWLARGGVYVVANIRGGGEYGPRWHRGALREKRHRAYEDFAAVAQDLVDRGVTTPAQLGARGGSNGGLLMGNMLTGYPELFGAIVCQVPLLDMKRYSHLLAGASWVAEYGDPDLPSDWAFLRTFSPYHRVRADAQYPPVLLTTSTRDDRVHPGHARKMAALLGAVGADVLFWENTEGGHGGAASSAQRATMNALAYEFLWQRLG